ncbi:MAG: antibiotic biosynthesis monooxygenase [Euzebyaceae bacterium]|nr:antibiotic biosynthesis monooxygenase [Euzebyaceae bacterium]
MLDALEAEPEPVPGLTSAQFHASTDGRQVINYAEWTSEQAHSDALDRGPDGVGQTDLPEWRRVRAFPGVTSNTVTRYILHQALTPRLT